MKSLFDKVSNKASKTTTQTYSTSFSLGIYCLNRNIHSAIYNIYGFVRFADEIVDSFHGYDQKVLFDEFKRDTFLTIERKISLNPILNSFQQVVNDYQIDHELIHCFLRSMETDLSVNSHSAQSYDEYILGSAEVVGLMCLHVFTGGNLEMYKQLKPSAMRLGAAFQKVNFLRDMRADYLQLGRVYFPSLKMNEFNELVKQRIEHEIEEDFKEAIAGIKKLPASSRFGVYVAYVYYLALFKKIKNLASADVLKQRIRVSNLEKIKLLISSYCRFSLNTL
ncbi:MAG: phytoene/squalene synthase family protein [Sphingobacteriaceae bacterium]|nr:phytoene/squalene synthase family protein [Sphingobacteriaceae bacterium]